MIHLSAVLSQHFPPPALSGAVRSLLGNPLRRAAPLTQLAVLGALSCLPPADRQRPTALLWQTTGGPREETLKLLDEVCSGAGEPMPYDFLATQPTIAAAQLKPFLPGLQSASCFPLSSATSTHWALLLSLACNWLNEGQYDQVLCAHLDCTSDVAQGHWLALSRLPIENTRCSLHLTTMISSEALPDTTDFPIRLAAWMASPGQAPLQLESAPAGRLALEFAQP